MKRYLLFGLVFAAGAFVGSTVGEKYRVQRTDDPGVVTSAGHECDFDVRRGTEPTVTYRPHAVHTDGHRTYLSGTVLAPDAAVTVFTFEGGRVKVAATEVTAGAGSPSP
jgi:hypothetical protein